ncbi:MAG TPA: hypothetical protein VGH79_08655 [Gaiellaceae bacterium]
MNRRLLARPTTWLAAAVWAFLLGLSILLVALHVAGWRGAGNTSGTSGAAFFLSLLAFATMGALVAAHVPRNAIGWIFLAIPLGAAMSGLMELLAFQGLVYRPGSVPGALAFAWVYSWCWYPTIGLLGFILLLYPTGKVPGPRWRYVAWALGIALSITTLSSMLKAGRLDGDAHLPANPLGVNAFTAVISGIDKVAAPCVTGLILVALFSVIVRFRRSRGEERQQMKWMACAATVLGASFLVPDSLGVGDIVFAIAITTLPVSLGIAMFKYRLYEIDRVINKTLVYGVSTALLAGAYVGLVIASEAAFASLARGSSVAVALSTLVVAGLFMPVRRRVQSFVDRRFYRRRYDAQRTLEDFSARLREEVDLDTLRFDLERVVDETMRPASVSVWVRTREATS